MMSTVCLYLKCNVLRNVFIVCKKLINEIPWGAVIKYARLLMVTHLIT